MGVFLNEQSEDLPHDTTCKLGYLESIDKRFKGSPVVLRRCKNDSCLIKRKARLTINPI